MMIMPTQTTVAAAIVRSSMAGSCSTSGGMGESSMGGSSSDGMEGNFGAGYRRSGEASVCVEVH